MSIKDFNLTQAKYEEDIVKILAEFQEMEHKRIESIQDVMQKYNMIMVRSFSLLSFSLLLLMQQQQQVSYATGFEQGRLLLYKSIEAVNGVADVQIFIEDHKTGQSPPPPVEFEPYVDTTPALPAKPNASGSGSPITHTRPKSEVCCNATKI